MTRPEPATLDELIADCAAIPSSLCTCHAHVPPPRSAAPWEVDDACFDQVAGLDEYV